MVGELEHGLAIFRFQELGHGKVAEPLNADKEVEFCTHQLKLGDVDMQEAKVTSLESRPICFANLYIWQARDAMQLKSPMQR